MIQALYSQSTNGNRNTFLGRLTRHLLGLILARLIVRDVARMRIVCKRWKNILPPRDALQRKDPKFLVNSILALLIQISWGWGPRHKETWVIELGHGGSLDINI